MFPKGPRFQNNVANDVPGPGYYTPVDIDTLATSNKRGAFLEKADRFDKENPSNTPGPNSYLSTQQAGPSRPPPASSGVIKQQLDVLRAELEREHQKELQSYESRAIRAEAKNQDLVKERSALQASVSNAERELRLASQREASLRTLLDKTESTLGHLKERSGNYADLQKKVGNLEAMHAESKRRQKEEVDQLQGELGRQCKLHASQIKELEVVKSALATEQQARRDMTKLEHEKKVVLEQSYSTERQRRENAEARLRNTIQTSEEAVTQSLALRSEILDAKGELTEARKSLEHYTLQLEDAHALIANMAHIQGRHVANSISVSVHRPLKFENARMEMLIARLDRKLADRVGQVAELAQMILHISEQNALLKAELEAADEEIHCLRGALSRQEMQCPCTGITSELYALCTSLSELDASTRCMSSEDIAAQQSIAAYASARSGKVLRSILDMLSEQAHLSELQERYADILITHAERDILTASDRVSTAELTVASKESELASKEDELERQTEMVAELRIRDRDLERRATAAEECLAQESAEARRAHAAHFIQVKSISEALSRARMAEQGLRHDVSNLEAALSDTIKFQDAHDALLKQVSILVSRNALAEEEAEHLSRFNAQILGHTNVNQRIYYVDRLRKEMTEVKQKLLNAEWERNTVKEENASLRHELDSYKSVTGTSSGNAPALSKVVTDFSAPKTKLTRIDRIPLAAKSTNSGREEQDAPSSMGRSSNEERMSVTELSRR